MTRCGWRAAGLLKALLLAACATDGESALAPEVDVPGRFAGAEEAPAAFPDRAWWQGFGSAELDRFVTEALLANSDLRAAETRLRQADAQIRIAGAALLPTLDAGGGATRTRSAQNSAAGTRLSDSFDIGLTAAWELDLSGGNRAFLAASEALGIATRRDRDALALSVASAVAESYFQTLSLRDRLDLALANLDNAQRVLELVEVRVANGAASALELAQQRTQVANQSAALPALVQQERQTVNALALLLGRPLDGFGVEGQELRSVTPVPVVAGMPSELLRRRPDIAAAEARLEAAAADIEAARAALYPSIGLTARAGNASDRLVDLLDGNFVSVGVSILAPIFAGGRLRAQVDLSEAQQQELLESYRGTVLAALADAEDALIAVRYAREREAALSIAAAEAQRAFTLAEAQYRGGFIDLLSLLDAQRALFAADEALAVARLDRLLALVALYRALGGGWAEL
jgi:NodT family efflux transporter outer membrane factor (OMF) lipoprotein